MVASCLLGSVALLGASTTRADDDSGSGGLCEGDSFVRTATVYDDDFLRARLPYTGNGMTNVGRFVECGDDDRQAH